MDISEILSSLSNEDMEKLKSAAQSIMGSMNEKPKTEKQENGAFNFDPALFAGLSKVSSVLSGDDDRTALIKALKPMLSEPRQEKADEAIKILKLMQLIPLLKSSGILKDLI